MKNMEKFFKTLLKLLVSLAILVLLATRIDFGSILTSLKLLSWQMVIPTLLFYVVFCQGFSCLRWSLVLRASGYHVPLHRLLAIYFAGMFVNIFMPTSVGGDFYRIYRVSKAIDNLDVAAASVILERFMGLIAVFLLALVSLPLSIAMFHRADLLLPFILSGSAIAGAVGLTLSPKLLAAVYPVFERLHLTKVANRLKSIQQVLVQCAASPQSVVQVMAAAILVQLCVPLYICLLAWQMHIPLTYPQMLIFQPISIVVTLLPISFGGSLGVQEGLWVYLFTRIGVQASQAIALSLTFTGFGWLLSLPGSLVLLKDSWGSKHKTSTMSSNPPRSSLLSYQSKGVDP
jgi:glycosyltransferase 2 family protein